MMCLCEIAMDVAHHYNQNRCRRCCQSTGDVSTQKIVSLCIIAILTNACYTTIAPILPLELSHHYKQHPAKDEEDYISVIFLFFSLGSTITPPLVSRYFETSCGGTIKIMSIAMIGMALLFSCLGSVFRLHNFWMMQLLLQKTDEVDSGTFEKSNIELIILICTIQFCIGGLLSIVTTGYYSSATLIGTSHPDRVISFLETAIGAGYILGPVIGSWLYDELGYAYMYRVVSIVMALLGLVTFKIFSPLFATKKVDDGDECQEVNAMECATSTNDGGYNSTLPDDLESRLHNKGRSVNHCNERQPLLPLATDVTLTSSTALRPTIAHLLNHPRILVSALCITWINFAWTFVEPILSLRMSSFFHLGKKEIGVIFSLSNVVYIPAVFLLQNAFVGLKMKRRRFIVLISITFTPLAVLLIGSNSVLFLVFGMLLLGLLPTPVWIILLPSMQEDALAIYPDTRHCRMANDLTAGIYNSFMIFGQVVGYILGPALNVTVGFYYTTWIVSGLILAQAILYYYFVLRNDSDGRLKSARKEKDIV